MSAPDLLDVLREIEADARRARTDLNTGRIPSGGSALQRIYERASDAVRWTEHPDGGMAPHEPSTAPDRVCSCGSGHKRRQCHGVAEATT